MITVSNYNYFAQVRNCLGFARSAVNSPTGDVGQVTRLCRAHDLNVSRVCWRRAPIAGDKAAMTEHYNIRIFIISLSRKTSTTHWCPLEIADLIPDFQRISGKRVLLSSSHSPWIPRKCNENSLRGAKLAFDTNRCVHHFRQWIKL